MAPSDRGGGTEADEVTAIARPVRSVVVGGTAPLSGGDPIVSPLGPREPDHVRLFEVIGRGGMGEVYRAEQLDLARSVAFKQLHPGSTSRQRERFAREARLTAQLDHPSIVPVHLFEVARDGGPSGYVMKLVEGKTLRTLLREAADLHEQGKPIDEEHALSTHLEHFLKICDAVSFAHDKGVLHRDLKPPNIMIGRFGEVYVMDWGIARRLDSEEDDDFGGGHLASAEPDLTQAGEVVGSASYMAPEQAQGRNPELDARADQYSLGLILFEIVTLKRALVGDSHDEIVLAASRGEKAPLEHVAKGSKIAPELAAIIDKATRVAPAERYHSVAALAADVRRFIQGDAVIALPEGAFGRLLRWIGKHRRATLVTLAGLAALVALVTSFTLYREAARELAAHERAERVTAFSIDASSQAHRIDAEFQKMEEALEGLRTAAEFALAGPEPNPVDAPIYFDRDFASPAMRPADFSADTKYRWPVSIDHPVVGVSPGTDRRAIVPKVRRLSPLRHHIHQMIVAAARGDDAALSPAEVRAVLANREGPIDYAYVDLKEGVHYVYPGIDSLPEGYDVRTASFYTMSENKRGKRWGSPYVDTTTDEAGDDLVLPCTQGIWSSTGEFLGVVGVEITVTKLVETSLALPTRPMLRASLVDGQGRKIVDSGDANKRFKAAKDESIELAPFDVPEIVTAIVAGTEGVREVRRDGRLELVAWSRLPVLGWYYVVEVDAASVVGR